MTTTQKAFAYFLLMIAIAFLLWWIGGLFSDTVRTGLMVTVFIIYFVAIVSWLVVKSSNNK